MFITVKIATTYLRCAEYSAQSLNLNLTTIPVLQISKLSLRKAKLQYRHRVNGNAYISLYHNTLLMKIPKLIWSLYFKIFLSRNSRSRITVIPPLLPLSSPTHSTTHLPSDTHIRSLHPLAFFQAFTELFPLLRLSYLSFPFKRTPTHPPRWDSDFEIFAPSPKED